MGIEAAVNGSDRLTLQELTLQLRSRMPEDKFAQLNSRLSILRSSSEHVSSEAILREIVNVVGNEVMHELIAARRTKNMKLETNPSDTAVEFTVANAEQETPNAGPKKERKQRPNFNTQTIGVLKAWLFAPEHVAKPYPTKEEKQQLMNQTGLNQKQLDTWFTNGRQQLMPYV
jgi:hypothetical protein